MAPPGYRLIEWAAQWVPFPRRSEWRREWEAEVAYSWHLLNQEGPPSWWARQRLRLRTMTCVIDALWEKKETMTMNGLFNDLRFAFRSLRRNPGFTLVAVGTLALGIGANTAVFTLVDGVLLEPLPFDDPGELVSLQHLGREGRDELPMSTGLYLLYRDQVSSLEEIGLHAGTMATLMVEGEPTRIEAQAVTPSFFTVLGANTTVGRTFVEEEGLPGADPTVILSDGLWRSHFGGDPAIVGQTLDMNGVSRTVVGIMPPEFGHPDRNARLWVPIAIDPARAPLAAFGADGVGRLSPASSIESLTGEMESLIGRLGELFPDEGSPAFLAEVGLRPRVMPLKEAVVGELSTTLWILLGMVGFVLLIACANVANLLLVRAEARQRELALRMAVGAGRMDVIRSFMAESILLAAAGGALGIAIASAAVQASLSAVPSDLPRMAEIGVDVRILGFTALVSVACALFFGLFPMVRSGAGDLAARLRDGAGRGSTAGPVRHRLRNGLVITQMALALVLLIGSGLMFRSFQALRSMDPGFEIGSALTARVSIPRAEIEDDLEVVALFEQLRQNLADQPGVVSVGMITRTPLVGGLSYTSLEVEDHPRSENEMPVFSSNAFTGVGYFETMGIPLVEGRTLQRGDGAEGGRAVVVSESFARHWWPDVSPIGRRLRAGYDGEEWYNIVGVVGDVHQNGLDEPPEETVYYPTTQGLADDPVTARTLDVIVRTTGDPSQFITVMRRELRALAPRIPLSDPRTLADVFREASARTSFAMALLGAASGIALLLGMVGIYGVISYVVSERTNEIGVRMALGASAGSVRGMVVRQGLTLAVAGAVLGMVVAASLSSLMGSLLFGVSALDPTTYAAVAITLVAVSTLASWIPAHRAAGVDPARALRAE